jgi:uncharacterized protein
MALTFFADGVHWTATAYTQDPWHPLTLAYGTAAEGAVNQAYDSGLGMYYIVMVSNLQVRWSHYGILLCLQALVSFIFLIGSLRTNIPFVIVFTCLVCLFGLFAGGQIHIGMDPTAAGIERATYLFKIAGGFGFVAAVMGWYLAIITVCASTGVPCPLPVFDLSTKVFSHSKAQTNEHAGSVRDPEIKA